MGETHRVSEHHDGRSCGPHRAEQCLVLCVLLLVPWQCHTSMQRRNLLTTECGFHDFVLLPENTASEPLKRTLSPMLADHLEPAMGLTRVGVPSALPELKFTHDLLIQPLNARTSAMSPTASAPSKDFHSRCFEVGWAHYTAPLIPVLGTCLVESDIRAAFCQAPDQGRTSPPSTAGCLPSTLH